jgi:hypothetical protein
LPKSIRRRWADAACFKAACHLGKGEAESSIRIAHADDEHDIGYTRSDVDAADYAAAAAFFGGKRP